MEHRLIIHLGYPKSGSTTLQRGLFDTHEGVNYFGTIPTANVGRDTPIEDPTSRYLNDQRLQDLHHCLTVADEGAYSEQKVDNLFQKCVAPHLAGGVTNLLSNERFLSVYFAYPDLEEKAHRLKRLVPDAQIVVVIRNQFDIITSQYRDWPFDPRDFTGGAPVSIDRWVDLALEHDDEIGFLRSLQYDKVIDLYEALFGAEAVSVFCLERLAGDVAFFAQDLSSCLQIDASQTETLLRNCHENKGVTRKRNIYRRLIRACSLGCIERLLRRVEHATGTALMSQLDAILDSGPKAAYTMSTPQEQKIQDFFSRSNHSLERSHQLQLSEYGYPS